MLCPFRAVLALSLWILVVCAAPARTQEVRIEGGAELDVVQQARDVLSRGAYDLVRTDTVLPERYHAPGDLVVVDADVRLEGRVDGDVLVVRGGVLFIRPEARIGGTVLSIGGLIVESGLGPSADILHVTSAVQVEVDEPAAETVLVTVRPSPPGPALVLVGIYGLNPFGLQYDRVDGLSIPWEIDWFPTRDEGRLMVIGRLTYRSARGALDPFVEAEAKIGRWAVEAEAGRTTRTPDGWAASALKNTPAALLLGSDYRNYFQSDMVQAAISRPEGWQIGATGLHLLPRLEAEVSRDRSLPAGDPWSLFGSLDRPNPPIDDGTVFSMRPGIAALWPASTVRFSGTAVGEIGAVGHRGADWTPFSYLVVDGQWGMDAFANHTLNLRFHLRHPLGGRVPRQRWSLLGGSPTLPTFPIGAFRGDRLEFVESWYDVPTEWIELPLLGSPVLRLQHAAGMAWPSGEERPGWEQNIGAGVGFRGLRVDVWIDPADRSTAISVGVTSPF